MSSERSRMGCPVCAEPNLLTATHCRRCDTRLPWADQLEGVLDGAGKNPSRLESAIEGKLQDWGLLEPGTVTCRFCEGPIEVDTKQCPHCGEWLTKWTTLSRVDRGVAKYGEKDGENANVIENNGRVGCFSVLSVLVLSGIVWFWR